jgi:hypothetical protein
LSLAIRIMARRSALIKAEHGEHRAQAALIHLKSPRLRPCRGAGKPAKARV